MADNLYPVTSYEKLFREGHVDSSVIDAFKSHGVLVLTGVFDATACSDYRESIVRSLEAVSPPLGPEDTWKSANLPSGGKVGLFQSLVSTFPAVLELRANPKIRRIFESVYSHLRGKNITELFTSMDGINVKPPTKPFHKDDEKYDWAHLDQTVRNDVFKCVQGQVVLSNTTAGFRASPKSHLIYEDLLKLAGISEKESSNWCKFSHPYDDYKAKVLAAGGQWQIPIRAPEGSVILWFSSTVHSAMFQKIPQTPTTTELKSSDKSVESDEKFKDWRFVVYVCLRPKSDLSAARRKTHAKRLQLCLEESRVTNHWGTRMFPKKRFREAPKNDELNDIHENPRKVRKLVGTPSEQIMVDFQKLICE